METSFPSENVVEKTYQDYKATISSLPRQTLAVKDNTIQACQYQGFWHYPSFLGGLMAAQDHFKAQPSDILIATYPKTGSTWLRALCFSITTRKKFNFSNNPLKEVMPHDCIPMLEVDLSQNQPHAYFRDIVPVLATHSPYISLPESIILSGCKIIYIWRDPCDTFVSLWHYMHNVFPEETEFVPLEEAFEQFCHGYSLYGPYWDHILGYWKASLERPGKVLFLKYEDLRNNTVFDVKLLANFMGCPFSMEEEKNGVVEEIIKLCSFENLSSLEVNRRGKLDRPHILLTINNEAYFRKGEVGDWKNHLTDEMRKKLDQIMELKLKGSGLPLYV